MLHAGYPTRTVSKSKSHSSLLLLPLGCPRSRQIVRTTKENCESVQAAPSKWRIHVLDLGQGGAEKCNYVVTEDSKDFCMLTHVTPTTLTSNGRPPTARCVAC
eukprot:scaffold1523_cov426-Prasinococcus_capsulatus_cf.AAC.5